jgi:signal transduction histidine kinase/ligand-binding sensor domain-containing protein
MDNCDRQMRFRTLKRLAGLTLLLCLVLVLPAYAQDQFISQMVHTSWTGRDGAPQAITSLAQTPEGVLWISTIAGLYHFDGVSFSAFEPLPGETSFSGIAIYSLYVSKAGDLWATFRHGGAARIRQDHVTVFDHVDPELDYVTLTGLQQDSNGTMWAILNERGLLTLGSDGVWHPVEAPIHGAAHITSLFIDSAGTQWVVANDLLYRRPRGQVSYSPTEIHAEGPSKVAEAFDHTLWIVGQIPGTGRAGHGLDLQHIDPSAKRLRCPPVEGELLDVLPTPDGSVWLSKAGEGLIRLPEADRGAEHRGNPAEVMDRYSVTDGLPSKQEWALSNDEDGNVWVGGVSGLDRFERATLVPAIGGARPGYWYTCTNQQGDVWGADEQGLLFSFSHGRADRIEAGTDIGGLFCGLGRRIWILNRWGTISYVQNGRIRRLADIPGQTRFVDNYNFVSVAEVSKDQLVAASWGPFGESLWIFRRGRWEPFLREHAASRINVVKAVGGRVYLGYGDGKIEVFQPETGKRITSAAPGIGEVVAFSKAPEGFFALGYDGIAAEHSNGFERLSFLHRDSAARVSGLVESRDGDFWINGARGIVHIPRTEMVAALASPSHLISSDEVHEGNFVGPAYCPVGRESATIDASGMLWFATLNGVVSLDPERLRVARHPPQLSILAITADGIPMDASAKFPHDIRTLDVRYFGLDLTDPRRVTYRYRLDGLDTSWQEVGSRTEAIYTQLRSGKYTFHVMASNGNGVWTAPISSVAFTVLPHFYERRAFLGLCFVATVVLLWLAYALRLRFATRAIRMRAEERADERIRIARELHDTLLQGVQGLLLTFHVAAEKVPAQHDSKQALERALATADRIILEGRNRVSRLRSENLTDRELKPSIERVGAELKSNPLIEFAVERLGGSESLDAPVVDEVFCIAREALTNAFRHAAASRIVVELDYQRRRFTFSCRDNGRGFDSGVVQASQTNGHWGLRGMAERAAKIGAKFSCISSPEEGTAVQVTVPARRAYARTNGFQLFSRRGRAV